MIFLYGIRCFRGLTRGLQVGRKEYLSKGVKEVKLRALYQASPLVLCSCFMLLSVLRKN